MPPRLVFSYYFDSSLIIFRTGGCSWERIPGELCSYPITCKRYHLPCYRTNGSTTFTPMTPPQTAFAEELIAYWISFVRSHDPNTFKLSRSPEWPQFTLDGLSRIVLTQNPNNSTTVSGSTTEKEDAVEKARCQFVASVEPEQQN
jgi:hypothetical protein